MAIGIVFAGLGLASEQRVRDACGPDRIISDPECVHNMSAAGDLQLAGVGVALLGIVMAILVGQFPVRPGTPQSELVPGRSSPVLWVAIEATGIASFGFGMLLLPYFGTGYCNLNCGTTIVPLMLFAGLGLATAGWAMRIISR
jgi:hypothetical protein